VPHGDQFLWMRIGQGLEENSVYHAEYRRVRPDTKRQRHSRDDGEARVVA